MNATTFYGPLPAGRPLCRPRSTPCAPAFSEFGLIRARLKVESVAQSPGRRASFWRNPALLAWWRNSTPWSLNFGPSRAGVAEVQAIEAVTNHDVKALEYWIKKPDQGNAEW